MATCANHVGTQAVAYCRTCGKPLCEACKHDVRGVVYCEGCIAARLGDTIPPGVAVGMPPGAVAVDAPNVGLATFLGFIPGVGAMYNGQFLKGFAHIFIFAMLAHAADRADFFGLFVAAFIAYMVIDANKTAKAKHYGQPLPDLLGISALLGQTGLDSATSGNIFHKANTVIDRAGQERNKPPIAALILIGLGVLFLLDNIGAFHFGWMNTLWPIFIIGLGVWLGYRRWQMGSEMQ
jgi:TM2 domain-containing membrane protein YozV